MSLCYFFRLPPKEAYQTIKKERKQKEADHKMMMICSRRLSFYVYGTVVIFLIIADLKRRITIQLDE